MKAHDTEKPLSSPKELEPGKWCEYIGKAKGLIFTPSKMSCS
jgi:hypothetical protein